MCASWFFARRQYLSFKARAGGRPTTHTDRGGVDRYSTEADFTTDIESDADTRGALNLDGGGTDEEVVWEQAKQATRAGAFSPIVHAHSFTKRRTFSWSEQS